MRTMPCSLTVNAVFIVVVVLSPLLITAVNCLGSASTLAIITGTNTVCGILASETAQGIQCYQNGGIIPILPNVSFDVISGGRNFFCGLRSGGSSLHCWETRMIVNSGSFQPKRLYHSDTVPLTDISVGLDHVCSIEVNSGTVKCWRGRGDGGDSNSPFPSPPEELHFRAITSGSGFTCGILRNNGSVSCWGGSEIGFEIQRQFSNLSMLTLVAGESHACGLDRTGILHCGGNNSSGQLTVPSSSPFEFSCLALGGNYSCAIRDRNNTVLCWGESTNGISQVKDVSFETIVSGSSFICGLTTWNLTVICWGSGWTEEVDMSSNLPLGIIIPGPCVQSSCNNCGMYPNSDDLCEASKIICNKCHIELPMALPLPPPAAIAPSSPVAPPASDGNRLRLVFIIVGSVGGFVGICAVVFCLWVGLFNYCFQDNNSVQPTYVDTTTTLTATTTTTTTTTATDATLALPPLLSASGSRRYSSRRLLRQKSGSSFQLVEKAEFFSLSELSAATNGFALENKIGSGSFGIVYKGMLPDGREVAIKRGETNTLLKKFQEKETAFDSELALLTRLHHKHLVSLVGFCQENDERLLVYEYMSNGALHDHLHKNNNNNSEGILNYWKMRIKIALDAARGIDYLHNYAVPPIIHRDIKSSNILLDLNWIARVSDFGLSLMGPGSDQEIMPMKAVGTVGYIDPEYYVLNTLNAKSDVYSFGVVLLELLTGKRAVFKNEEDGIGPMGVVEYAVPLISSGQLAKVLDKRVEPPRMNEAEAVEILAATALLCVNLEGKERPNITDIVANLETALALFDQDGYTGRLSTSNFSVFAD